MTPRAQALDLLAGGASYREVARTLGVDPSTVRRWHPGRGWTREQGAQFRLLTERSRLSY